MRENVSLVICKHGWQTAGLQRDGAKGARLLFVTHAHICSTNRPLDTKAPCNDFSSNAPMATYHLPLAGTRFCIGHAGLHWAHANGFNAQTYDPLAPLVGDFDVYGADARGHGFNVAADPAQYPGWTQYRNDLIGVTNICATRRAKKSAGYLQWRVRVCYGRRKTPRSGGGSVLADPVIVPRRSVLARMTFRNKGGFALAVNAAKRRADWPDAETVIKAYTGRGRFKPGRIFRGLCRWRRAATERGWRKHRDAGLCAGMEAANFGVNAITAQAPRAVESALHADNGRKRLDHAVGSVVSAGARAEKNEVIAEARIFCQWNFPTACALKFMRVPAHRLAAKLRASRGRSVGDLSCIKWRAHQSARAFLGFEVKAHKAGIETADKAPVPKLYRRCSTRAAR